MRDETRSTSTRFYDPGIPTGATPRICRSGGVEPAGDQAQRTPPPAAADHGGQEGGAPTPDKGYGLWSRPALALLVTCLLINLLGREFVDLLHLPVYLDMVGTAVAAIVLGPWCGALVGGATNTVGIVGSGLISLPFAVVNIIGALVWGCGVRRFGAGATLPRFFGVNMACALACSAVAVPILMLVYGGSVGQGQDTVTASFEEITSIHLVAVSLSNLLTSVGDKLISGFLALVFVASLPLMFRRGTRLVVVDPDL